MIGGVRVYVSLGSNVGDRERTLRRALGALGAAGIVVLRVSSFYETQPRETGAQRWYVNCAAECATTLAPSRLLRRMGQIERELGRRHGRRRGARPVDLDLLFYDAWRAQAPELRLPHPGLYRRRFVLLPLGELNPALPGVRAALARPEVARQPLRRFSRSGG